MSSSAGPATSPQYGGTPEGPAWVTDAGTGGTWCRVHQRPAHECDQDLATWCEWGGEDPRSPLTLAQEWATCHDPRLMLRRLEHCLPGTHAPDARKLRLFCCAAWRRRYPISREAASAEAQEQWADGKAPRPQDVRAAWLAGNDRWQSAESAVMGAPEDELPHLAGMLRDLFGPDPFGPAPPRPRLRCSRGHDAFSSVKKDGFPVPLSRCLVCQEEGPPWPDVVSGGRHAWVTQDAWAVAQVAYEDRPLAECGACEGRGGRHVSYPERDDRAAWWLDNQRWHDCTACAGVGRLAAPWLDAGQLGVLADACEDGGCKDQELLEHLRAQGQNHYKGCWALDRVLGKG